MQLRKLLHGFNFKILLVDANFNLPISIRFIISIKVDQDYLFTSLKS
ncbi:hypothetical protein BGAFAR04_F0005 (plasmid) [Borreliella garinii Far04]|nr:hypothetical protein BGAFAR04_F0005 [Borreliella garinii Far04]